MNAKLVISILALIFWSCNSSKNDFNEQLSKENLFTFKSKELNISLMVPKKSVLNEMNNRVLIDLNHNGRLIKQVSIKKAMSTIRIDKYPNAFTFGNSATLNYFLSKKNGGSGGTEYGLEGVFKIEDKTFFITSYDQKEFGKGEPEFCLKYLSTIKILKTFDSKDQIN